MRCSLGKKENQKVYFGNQSQTAIIFSIFRENSSGLGRGIKKAERGERAHSKAADGAHLASPSLTTRALAYRDIMRPDSSRTRAKTPAFALLVCSIALLVRGGNGQTPAPNASGGSYVDVSSNATSEVEGRFGTQPSQRSGQSLVRLQPGYAPQHPRSDRSASSRNEHATVSFLGTR